MKTYAIGDIHGELGLLRKALDWIEADSRDSDYEVVCVGDYVDRGPDSAGVVDLLMKKESDDREWVSMSSLIDVAKNTGTELGDVMVNGGWDYESEKNGRLSVQDRIKLSGEYVCYHASRPRPNPRWVFLAGNHEDMMLRAVRGDDYWIQNWARNGGHDTTKSYMRYTEEKGLPSAFPEDHVRWIANLPIMHVSRGRVFVHAGVDPARPVEDQKRDTLLWDRSTEIWHVRYVHNNPIKDKDQNPLFVVHGHTPSKRHPHYLPGIKINVDTGACFGGRLTVAAWTDDEKHPRIFQVGKYNSSVKRWDEGNKTWLTT